MGIEADLRKPWYRSPLVARQWLESRRCSSEDCASCEGIDCQCILAVLQAAATSAALLRAPDQYAIAFGSRITRRHGEVERVIRLLVHERATTCRHHDLCATN